MGEFKNKVNGSAAESAAGADTAWNNFLEKELNREQKELVTLQAPAILGLAGPGSGKTRALIYRAAHLIKCGVPPSQILLVTFTNKAAEEMKNRLETILGYYPREMWAGTFHSTGARVLRKHASRLNRTPDFSIMDEDDSAALWKNLINRYKDTITEEEVNVFVKRRMAEKIISQACNSGFYIEEIVSEYYPWLEGYISWLQELYQKYETGKEEMNAFDFDDLLVKWLKLFRDYPEVRQQYLDRFKHVLCDEYQDTNVIQGSLVDFFAENSSICVVGDDAQSIYGFRFADIGNMLQFPERHTGCRVIRIEQNFRSHPEIVDVANEIISHNFHQHPKKLYSRKPPGREPVVCRVDDAHREAKYVADRIEELLNAGADPSEMAVLYRSSYLSSEVEFELLRRKMKYRTFGGRKLVQKAHVKDVLAWLKVMYNPRDVVSWRRIISMQKGLGPASCEKVISRISCSEEPVKDILEGGIAPSRGKEGWQTVTGTLHYLSEAGSINHMILSILNQGYYGELQKRYPESWEERYRDIERLADYGERYRDLGAFLEVLSLEEALVWDEVEPVSRPEKYITLSTIHSAKGKEWDTVFIIALNDGAFPGRRATDIEEERRLFYVAATRARKYLFLTSYEYDYRFGRVEVTGPSLFLREISAYGDGLDGERLDF